REEQENKKSNKLQSMISVPEVQEKDEDEGGLGDRKQNVTLQSNTDTNANINTNTNINESENVNVNENDNDNDNVNVNVNANINNNETEGNNASLSIGDYAARHKQRGGTEFQKDFETPPPATHSSSSLLNKNKMTETTKSVTHDKATLADEKLHLTFLIKKKKKKKM
ncbi:hypothetical protein RFI_04071, partial [Reticulomyxa filosa]